MNDINTSFSDNFWECPEKNGITVLLERMRGAKQSCERLKNAYEARALLEEEYGKTLLQIAQKQKASSTENGKSKSSLDMMQTETQSIAESHIQLSCLLRDNVVIPLTKLINKQKTVRKELQTSIQKLYNNRQLQVNFVRRAHKRHNQEIEKANAAVEEQLTEEDKQAAFKMAQPTIEKLKNVYDEGLKDLSKIVEEWNTEWKNTCLSFEKMEQERIQFLKLNLSNYANLIIGCLENEIQAYERVNDSTKDIDTDIDLAEFVNENRSTHIVPSSMDYIKLHAYSETDQGKGVVKHTFHAAIDHEENSDAEDHEQIKKNVAISLDNRLEKEEVLEADLHEKPELEPSNPMTSMTSAIEEPSEVEALSIMMIGKMEVYGSDEDDEEYVYVTDTESEGEEEKQVDIYSENKKEEIYDYDLPSEQYNTATAVEIIHTPQESDRNNDRPQIESIQPKSQSISEEKVDHAASSASPTLSTISDPYSSILLKKGLNTKRRVSFLSENRDELNMENLSQPKPNSLNGESLADKVRRVVSSDSVVNESSSSIEQEEAAAELDNMLRELDATHRSRSGLYKQPDIRPTASASSPGILQDRRNSYFKQQSRRLSVADMDTGSVRYGKDLQQQRVQSPKGSDNASYPSSTTTSDQGDFYDPFYSLSSRTASTFNSNDQIKPTKSISASTPTAQMIHERMLKNSKMDSYYRRSSINTNTVSSGSRDNKNGFIHDFYNTKSNITSLKDNKEQFIDFAVALYDYEVADEGEISFKQGDLLGIISKGDDGDDQGWWEASLLDKQNQKVVRTGLVPSNFIETAFRA